MQKTKVSTISKVFIGLLEQSAFAEAGLISSVREWERLQSAPVSDGYHQAVCVQQQGCESSSWDNRFGVNILESLPSLRCLSHTFAMKGKDQWGIL